MKFYKPFKSCEEAEVYLGQKCIVEGKPAIFTQCNLDNKLLTVSFELEEGGIVAFNSLSAFYVVTVKGHPFGKEEDEQD